MSKPPQRFVDDPTSHEGLREALELSAEAPSGYDTDKGLARLKAALIAIPTEMGEPDVPDSVPDSVPDATAPDMAAPGAQAGALGSVSALWWGLAAVGAAGVLLGGYYAWPRDDAGPAESAQSAPSEATGQIQTPQTQTPQIQTPQTRTPQIQTPQIQTPQTQTPQTRTPPGQAAPEPRGAAVQPAETSGAEPPGIEAVLEPLAEALQDHSADRAARSTRDAERGSRADDGVRPGRAPSPSLDDLVDNDVVLRREIAQLAATRRALSESPARGLTLARQGQREFPSGMFGEERAALAIFALGELGRSDQAQREARQFLRRYPNGPFSARVQALSTP